MRPWKCPCAVCSACSLAWCAASTAAAAPGPRRTLIEAQPRIVTADDVATEAELEARGERALLEQRWKDAAEAYRLLLAADPAGPRASEHMFNLGLSLEGLEQRAEARDTFLDLARHFPDGPKARSALVRVATLDAYLEDWTALEAIGEALLARPDLEDIDRIVALGARGLARVERMEQTANRAPRPRRAPTRRSMYAPPRTSTKGSISPTASTTASATFCRWRSRSCALRSASFGAFAPSASRSTRSRRTSSPSSTSVAPGCSKRRRRIRRRCDRSTRTGRRCRATASARCTATCTMT